MTPAGTSNELDVQNGWEENTHTHTQGGKNADKIVNADRGNQENSISKIKIDITINRKEGGREAQGAQSLKKNCQQGEREYARFVASGQRFS